MKKKTYNVNSTKNTNKKFAKISSIAKSTKKNVNGELKKLKQKYKRSTLGQKILIIFMLGITTLLILGLIFSLFIVISAPSFDTEKLYSKKVDE